MKYTIKKLNRTVELDDELVDLYTQYAELRDSIFIISIHLKYGDQDIDDEELSNICNETLVEDLENLRDNAIALRFVMENKEALLKAGWGSGAMEISVDQTTNCDGKRNEQ